MADINVTPLVDVMLVLLIIFIVTAPIMTYPIAVDLPQRVINPPPQLREIFRHARGRYGSTLDYARQTHEALRAHGIHDRALARLLAHADT